MNIQAIKKLCVESKTAMILNVPEGGQWIGDGAAFYLVDDAIRFTERNIPALFDLDEKIMSKMRITTQDILDPRFEPENIETETDRYYVHATFAGEDRAAVMLRQDINLTPEPRVVVFDAAKLKPIQAKNEYMEYRIRIAPDGHGVPVVAVNNGLLTIALIYPVEFNGAMKMLNMMRAATKFALLEGLPRADKDALTVDNGQEDMLEDEDDG